MSRTQPPLYAAGGVAAVALLLGTIGDIALTSVPGWGPATVPSTVAGWFAQLRTSPLLGLRNLDLLNALLSVVGLPMYVALYGAERRDARRLATLGVVVVTIGAAVFVMRNAALPMLELSRRYSVATDGAERLALEHAARALLARGAHGSTGALLGFVMSGAGTLLMACAMSFGRASGRGTAWPGIAGASLLLLYVVGTTFDLLPRAALLTLASLGGVLMMAWYVVVARRLFALARPVAPEAGAP